MKIIKKEETKEVRNSKGCVAIEYPSDDKDINGAVIKLSGREPDEGRVVNLECKELAYVIKGSGKVSIEGNEIELNEGDLVVIEPGERFYWEGEMEMFMPCAPAWHPGQYKKIK